MAICGGGATGGVAVAVTRTGATGTSVRILIGATVSGLTAAVTGPAIITRMSVIHMIKEPAESPEE